MKLANDVKRALARRKVGTWRANTLATEIRTGKIKLTRLRGLSVIAKCSLVYLTSGGAYEAREPLKPKEAVTKSIEHAGYDKHDFARKMGYKDYAYVAALLSSEMLPVRALIKFAEELNMEVWELLCDSECYPITYNETPQRENPSEWDQMVELNLMGWLDSKQRDQYEKQNGPGI